MSCFYSRRLEQLVGEMLRKFAEPCLPAPDPLIEAQVPLTRTLHCHSQGLTMANLWYFGCRCCRNEYWLHQSDVQHLRLFRRAICLCCPEQVTVKDCQKWVSEQLDIWKMKSQRVFIEGCCTDQYVFLLQNQTILITLKTSMWTSSTLHQLRKRSK